jgi:Tfp pilus assembly protein PilN
MALKLNLYHEIEKLKAERRRDPLKISLMILGVVVACFAVLYFWEVGRSASLRRDLVRKKAEFDAIEPQAREARARLDSLQASIDAGTRLTQRIEGRFYWAPLLEQIITTVPREVQITKFQGDVQGDGLKKCQFTLDGISAGPDPRRVAEELRQALAEKLGARYKAVTAAFRQLEDGTEHATLDGQQFATATFAINVTLQHGEEEAPAPPPRTAKKAEPAGA